MIDCESSAYPLDFDALGKGSVISADEVSAAIGLPRHDRRFPLRAMRLADSITSALAGRGLRVIVRSERDALRILTDEEAVEYTERGFVESMRLAARRHVQARSIDAANLSDTSRSKLDRSLIVQAAQLSAATAARRQLKA